MGIKVNCSLWSEIYLYLEKLMLRKARFYINCDHGNGQYHIFIGWCNFKWLQHRVKRKQNRSDGRKVTCCFWFLVHLISNNVLPHNPWNVLQDCFYYFMSSPHKVHRPKRHICVLVLQVTSLCKLSLEVNANVKCSLYLSFLRKETVQVYLFIYSALAYMLYCCV